ncbi:hypothetical protein CLI92_07040 [Vandammella animalimorsus]|uniref:Uncharacterized protein n=1 Tax=Vandammella animalimorsus TaxID=2029117 RepID=A0A2A2AUF9_9BURK|nr:hypothetical protein CK626_04540 [Vandammella animalimorsus]PAT42225.1 hypothetical protein CK621_10555 [Vandammella animalimorsus]PAX16853.1 hypothetical protein CLI92_07040 [Vandammella animalimorsus]PAX20348.1 hypothetical protein CLI93_00870 [Vandammella animalimorsus]
MPHECGCVLPGATGWQRRKLAILRAIMLQHRFSDCAPRQAQGLALACALPVRPAPAACAAVAVIITKTTKG